MAARFVAKWRRHRKIHNLEVTVDDFSLCLATINKRTGRHGKRDAWEWSVAVRPYTCGECESLFDAKNAVAECVKELQAKGSE